MSSKRIQLRVYPDGRIEAVTQGVKGQACMDYIAVLEALLGAETITSEFIPEYHETEEEAVRPDPRVPRRVQGGA